MVMIINLHIQILVQLKSTDLSVSIGVAQLDKLNEFIKKEA